MRQRTGMIVLLVIVIVAVGLSAWWWTRPSAEPAEPTVGTTTDQDATTSPSPLSSSPPSSGTDDAPSVPAVRAVTVSEGATGRRIRLTGTVAAQRDVTLVAKVSGTVQWVAGEMGTRIEAGEPVVRLDDTELKLALAQSEAQLVAAEANLARLEAGAADEEIAQARASVQQAEVTLTRIGETLERQEQLFAQGVIAEETLLGLRTEYEVARLQYETAQQRLQLLTRGATAEERRAARAQVQQAEVAVQLAEQQLADAVIRAPFSGLLAAEPVQVGGLIGGGTPVAQLVDIDQVIIEAGVNEREVNRLSVGQTVQVRVDALGDTAVPGTVAAVAPVADQQTRTFPVQFRVDNPDQRLKPGMIARVDVELDRTSMGPSVPQAAVLQRGGHPVVFVLEGDGAGGYVVREQSVEVGTPSDGRVTVVGVAVGDVVVLPGGPPDALRDGMLVRPVELDGGAFSPDADGGGV